MVKCNVCHQQLPQTTGNFHTLTQGKNKGQPSKSCRTCTEKYWRPRYGLAKAKRTRPSSTPTPQPRTTSEAPPVKAKQPRKPVQKVADIGLQSLSWRDRRDRDLARHRTETVVRALNPVSSHEAKREQVERLMQEFLDSGGQIEVIPSGQSGIAR